MIWNLVKLERTHDCDKLLDVLKSLLFPAKYIVHMIYNR